MLNSQFGGSALDRPVNSERLERCYRKGAANVYSWDNKPQLPSMSAALWADRCNIRDAGNNGGPQETNHLPGAWPAGGNIGCLDGSVRWLRLSTYDNQDPNVWIFNGGYVGGHLALPPNAIFMTTGETLNFDGKLVMGRGGSGTTEGFL